MSSRFQISIVEPRSHVMKRTWRTTAKMRLLIHLSTRWIVWYVCLMRGQVETTNNEAGSGSWGSIFTLRFLFRWNSGERHGKHPVSQGSSDRLGLQSSNQRSIAPIYRASKRLIHSQGCLLGAQGSSQMDQYSAHAGCSHSRRGVALSRPKSPTGFGAFGY